MVMIRMTMNKVFLDTSFALALVAAKDAFHIRATQIAQRIKSESIGMLTTREVIIELANFLSRAKLRSAAVRLIDSIHSDLSIEIVEISQATFQQAYQLYAARMDKDWSLTDCISFVVMRDRKIDQALTSDHHFEQAGFTALLRCPLR